MCWCLFFDKKEKKEHNFEYIQSKNIGQFKELLKMLAPPLILQLDCMNVFFSANHLPFIMRWLPDVSRSGWKVSEEGKAMLIKI